MGNNPDKQQKSLLMNSSNSNLYHLDKVLKYDFKFQQQINICSKQQLFINKNPKLRDQIANYLIKMIQEVCSISFELFVSSKCTKYQSFNYASKNILENVKFICSQLCSQISKQNLKLLTSIKDESQRMKMKNSDLLPRQIIEFICSQVSIIVDTIFPKYPKTAASGYSQKLKKRIKNIDYREDYQLETLYLTGLVIEKVQDPRSQKQFLKKIKEFLNLLIDIPQKYQADFNEFNYHLTWIIAQSSITEDQVERSNKLLDFLINPNVFNTQQLQVYVKKGQDLFEKIQNDIQNYKKQEKALVNTKISSNTSKYDKDQLESNDFKIKSSPLLRVLTKWVQDIDETLKESQKYIRDNDYKFKNNQNQEIDLSINQRNILYKIIKREYAKIKKSKQNEQNNLVYDVLENQLVSNVSYYFEQSLKISSMLNAYIVKKTLKQLTELFKLLLGIPNMAKKQYENQYLLSDKSKDSKNDKEKEDPKDKRERKQKDALYKLTKEMNQLGNLNLVCNRVGDLLRGSIYCNQKQFIKLLILLESLDNYCQNNQNSKIKIKIKDKQDNEVEKKVAFFKIIRIKDNLNKPINNVHINYIFKGKIQCELQVYFIVKDKSIKKASAMHHFLYELKRGRYGIIPQLSNIVNQNDPITLYHQTPNLIFKKYPEKFQSKEFGKRKTKMQTKQQIWRCINKFCHEFSLESYHKFVNINKQYYCIKCYFLNPQHHHKSVFHQLAHFVYEPKQEYLKDLVQGVPIIQQMKEIQQNDNNLEDICLVITPTDKKVNVQYYAVYYSQTCSSLVMVNLQNGKLAYYNYQKIKDQQQKNKQKFYLKINRTKQLFNFIEKRAGGLKQILKIQNINNKKQEGQKKQNSKFFQQCLKNKQPNLKLNKRIGINEQLKKKLTNMNFVQRLYAQAIDIVSIEDYNKLTKLKQLHLSGNKIKGKVHVHNYQQLTFLDLSCNQIQKIKFKNVKNLKQILLNNNHLTAFKFDNLNNLVKLDLQENKFEKCLPLRNLAQLEHLNINYNSIDQLDILESSKISILYCKKNQKNHQKSPDLQINSYLLQLTQIILIKNNVKNYLNVISIATLKYMTIEINTTNYSNLFKLQFKQIRQIALRCKDIQNKDFQDCLRQFIVKLKQVDDIELSFFQCDIQQLDLSTLKQIQRFSLLQRTQQLETKLQTLKLKSTKKLISVGANLKVLQIQHWSKLQLIRVSQINLDKIIPFETFEVNKKKMQSIIINNCNILHELNFKGFQSLKEIMIYLGDCQYGIQQFKCQQNANLKKIELQLRVKDFSITKCDNLQYFSIGSSQDSKVNKANIQLSNLKQLIFQNIQIQTLDLKMQAKVVQKMQFKHGFKANNLVVQFEQICNLRELLVTSYNVNQLSTLLKKIQNVDKVDYWSKGIFQLQTSKICKSIKQLHFSQDKQQQQEPNPYQSATIEVDSQVTVLYLPNFARSINLIFKEGFNNLIYIRESSQAIWNELNLSNTSKKFIRIIFQISQARLALYKQRIKLDEGGQGQTIFRIFQDRFS